MFKKLTITLLLVVTSLAMFGQSQTVLLWKDVPNMKRYGSKLYVYPAPDSNRNRIAVIVCPGGSYSHLMGIKTEGYEVAEWLNSQGITAFVLRYRVGMNGHHHPAMIEDMQRAIQYVRENADKWQINPYQVGAMGFSAGGHLVTMSGAFANDNYLAPLGIRSSVSLRPDFVVPVYPVVSMQDSIAHQRSRKNLLTNNFTKEQQDKFSMELQIPDDMPPTFLVTAKDDPVVMYQNSVNLDKALTEKKIKHVFQLYETGGHGYGMSEEIAGDTAKWKWIFLKWVNEIFKMK